MSAKRTTSATSAKPRRAPVSLRIRSLTPEDRDEWIRLRRELWPNHPPKDLARDADMLLHSRKRNRFWRASMLATVILAKIESGKVVGFAEVDLRPYANGCRSSPVGYLEGWYVTPEYRRSGVGRILVRAAEAWACDQGCTEMASDTEVTNAPSQLAHIALGYTEVERLVHLRRDLPAAKLKHEARREVSDRVGWREAS